METDYDKYWILYGGNMHYHDPNTYYYEIRIENKDTINVIEGNVIANTRPKALDKIVREYECERNSIKLKCVPCIESYSYVIKLCPKCKSEMVRNDSFCYTSNPPQYEYVCKKCGHKTIGR
jgi:predicted RNA-binding Zn-ribbon protein involved in translation (DUF1610 family)